ncbi:MULTISPECIES: GlsB/YeaQ/YmgE family stress response membrane protein [Stappiaceae]|uniref:GlsB/YeaQ/YmgE family stress response membrane protein n=1 Tax=Roseibium polysiphoniae TaxID=2571221 RepID=A0A927Q5J4_9HYPH|nr:MULTISPECIES: GlsB/YeaQ/YmgE family stress response membrane protein [Stappiaceae]MBD8875932.1 GlsB/YeaQ/YmgE family stress response membrane protein [Roseibium polysiphoniae]MBS8259450.1 GlsB/YeaQ/YmgE family stress response membrane protein [Roseibium polysiphoniae]
MSFIFWIIIGLIAGAVAHRVLNSRGGFFGSLVVGLLGALVGGELAHIFRLNVTGGLLDQLVVSTLGAILFLYLWKKVFS